MDKEVKEGRNKKGQFEKGNSISVGNNGGRETLYDPSFNELAYNYCLLGATDEILAKYFEVDERTINNWKNEHSEFFQSIKKGKEEADVEVAISLFNRAKGFTKTVKKTFKLKKQVNGEGSDERLETAEDEVYIPPDTTAIIYWLKNRQPSLWRDKQEIDHTSKGEKIQHIALGSGVEIEKTTLEEPES